MLKEIMETHKEKDNKMLVKQDLINKIKDYFDLNEYETKVWLALLTKGIASAGQVAEISGVPRSRTYDVLESLEKRGFAIIKLGKPVKYLGVKPEMILEKLKNNVRKNAEEKVQYLAKIRDTEEFEKLNTLYSEGIQPSDRHNMSASLRGKSNISNYIKDILENTQKELIVCATAEEIAMKSKLFKDTFDRLQKNNIKVRVALSGEAKLIKDLEQKLNIKIKKNRY
jgi:HTH-type transcriptional regulator, sugar sensing transcriptional regulator